MDDALKNKRHRIFKCWDLAVPYPPITISGYAPAWVSAIPAAYLLCTTARHSRRLSALQMWTALT